MQTNVFKSLIIATVATVSVAGCGVAGKSMQSPTFNNQTNGSATDDQLQAFWGQAQQAIANPPNNCIVKAPVTDPKNPGCWPGDARALSLQPDNLTVELGPAPYNEYGEFQVSGTDSPDGWAWGVTLNSNAIEVAPTKVLSAGVTGYEMQNVILERLGYDVSGR